MREPPNTKLKQVRSLYAIMTGIENSLGGGEGIEGLYGSISGSNMQKILSIMKERCGLSENSHLVDIGAGLGRPLIHALVTEGLSAATGIEIDQIKCMKADVFLKQTAAALIRKQIVSPTSTALHSLPVITCTSIEHTHTLDPATHAYSFWEGVPTEARMAFGRLFAQSSTLQAVTVVQRRLHHGTNPAQMMEDDYCFGPLTLVDTISVKMSGSGQGFTAFVFNKACKHPILRATQERIAVTDDTPYRSNKERDTIVECDALEGMMRTSPSENEMEILRQGRKRHVRDLAHCILQSAIKKTRKRSDKIMSSSTMVVKGKSGIDKRINAGIKHREHDGSGSGSWDEVKEDTMMCDTNRGLAATLAAGK